MRALPQRNRRGCRPLLGHRERMRIAPATEVDAGLCKEKRPRVPDASQPRASVKGARLPAGSRTGSFLLNSQNSRFQYKSRRRLEEVKGGEWRRRPRFVGWFQPFDLFSRRCSFVLDCGGLGNPFPAWPRGRNMKLLHCAKRFLASDDGATDFENVVLVGCTVILCLSIQIIAH